MNLSKGSRVTIFAMGLAVAASAAAKAKDSRNVLLHYDATVAGSHLASGNYNVKLETHNPEAKITFVKGSKVVATVEGKLEDRGKKYSSDSVVYGQTADGSHVIQEIRFRGSSEVVVFKE